MQQWVRVQTSLWVQVQTVHAVHLYPNSSIPFSCDDDGQICFFLNQNSQKTRQQKLGPNVGFKKSGHFEAHIYAGVAFDRLFAYRGGNSSRGLEGFHESYGSL